MSDPLDPLIDPLKLAGSKPKGKRPYFLENRDTEKVLAVTMAIAQELAVLRERQDTVERLLEQKGVLSAKEIDDFIPRKEQAAQRGYWTQEYLARIFRIYQQEAESLKTPDEASSEDIGNELADDKS